VSSKNVRKTVAFSININNRILFNPNSDILVLKGKDIAVTGREGPEGSEKSRFPHFQDNRPTDGGEVISPTRQPPFTPQEDSWYSLLLEAESTPGP
jgi:hypothetical protein